MTLPASIEFKRKSTEEDVSFQDRHFTLLSLMIVWRKSTCEFSSNKEGNVSCDVLGLL